MSISEIVLAFASLLTALGMTAPRVLPLLSDRVLARALQLAKAQRKQ